MVYQIKATKTTPSKLAQCGSEAADDPYTSIADATTTSETQSLTRHTKHGENECARRSLKYPVAHSTRSHRHATHLGQCHDAPERRDAQFEKLWSMAYNLLQRLKASTRGKNEYEINSLWHLTLKLGGGPRH
ncbi:hypothetical protein EVAR_18257_1 [Eumeta japonica]|uniref:Uncharacterized protein n=1 Tax=Eumeta variegata TaxID=151549 RepID=A0A4C1UKE1_EUMVA|nr:hypothetical protein EVAR_18257_1 [Eumeta japonica]